MDIYLPWCWVQNSSSNKQEKRVRGITPCSSGGGARVADRNCKLWLRLSAADKAAISRDSRVNFSPVFLSLAVFT